jgi:hypothetical protein
MGKGQFSAPAELLAFRLDVQCIIVRYALQTGDMADGPERGSPYLADALRNRVGHSEELIGLFIKQQVVIAEVRPSCASESSWSSSEARTRPPE